MMCGGTTAAKPADEEAQAICNEIREQLQEKAGKTYGSLKAITYKTQVVAGTNYFIKVEVDGPEYLHIRVFKGLPHAGGKLELNSYQSGKSKEDDIEYF